MSSPESQRLSEIKENLEDNFIQNQDAKENNYLPVFARLRPLLHNEITKGYMDCVELLNETTLRCEAPVDSVRHKAVVVHNTDKLLEDFCFSHVFDKNIDQYDLFHDTMEAIVHSFMERQNCLVFAYGNTASGKTYTMQGTPSHPGVIPMTMQLLFAVIKDTMSEKINYRPQKFSDVVAVSPDKHSSLMNFKEKILSLFQEDSHRANETYFSCMSFAMSKIDKASLSSLKISRMESSSLLKNTLRCSLDGQSHCSVWVSFVEIYNERIYDLLQPFSTKRAYLKLGKDKAGNTYVKGAKEFWFCNVEEVLKFLQVGQKNLQMAGTKLNYQSSRSISFCDLAGSERSSKTENTGMRLKEAGHINVSLLVLGKCIKALRHKDKVIPFRESKLTRLFAGFFTGKGIASMLVNISPSSYTFDETLNVLRFSSLAQKLTVTPCIMPSSLNMVQRISSDWGNISKNLNESNLEDSSMLDSSTASDMKDQLFEELRQAYKTLETNYIEEKERNLLMETRLRKEIRFL